MANKPKDYTEVHLQAMRREGLDHRMWDLKCDFPSQFLIQHRITREYRMIPKRAIPKRFGS